MLALVRMMVMLQLGLLTAAASAFHPFAFTCVGPLPCPGRTLRRRALLLPSAPRGAGSSLPSPRRARSRTGAAALAASDGVHPEQADDMGTAQLAQFESLLRESLASETFVKATLSQNKGPDKTLTNAYFRLVSLKTGVSLQAKLRHKTNDVTKNYPVAEADAVVLGLLRGGFRQAYLFTTSGDWQLKLGKKPWLQRVGKGPTFVEATVEKHDRVKGLPVDKTAQYLQLLGITNAKGVPRPGRSDKLRQIQQFVSVVDRCVQVRRTARALLHAIAYAVLQPFCIRR